MQSEEECLVRALLAQTFDIRKMKKQCNNQECFNHPEKEVMLYEYRKNSRRHLFSAYLCSSHLEGVSELLVKIRKSLPRVIFETEQKDIGGR